MKTNHTFLFATVACAVAFTTSVSAEWLNNLQYQDYCSAKGAERREAYMCFFIDPWNFKRLSTKTFRGIIGPSTDSGMWIHIVLLPLGSPQGGRGGPAITNRQYMLEIDDYIPGTDPKYQGPKCRTATITDGSAVPVKTIETCPQKNIISEFPVNYFLMDTGSDRG